MAWLVLRFRQIRGLPKEEVKKLGDRKLTAQKAWYARKKEIKAAGLDRAERQERLERFRQNYEQQLRQIDKDRKRLVKQRAA